MKPLLVLLLIAACGCPQKKSDNAATQQPPPSGAETTTPPPTTQGPGSDTGSAGSTPPGPGSATPGAGSATPGTGTGSAGSSAAEPTPNWPKNAPGIGENCGPNDACAQGLTCVSYYGIAGARGPQFKSCEIKCTADSACPAGHKCVTIADGPGQVCRK